MGLILPVLFMPFLSLVVLCRFVLDTMILEFLIINKPMIDIFRSFEKALLILESMTEFWKLLNTILAQRRLKRRIFLKSQQIP